MGEDDYEVEKKNRDDQSYKKAATPRPERI